MISHADGGIGAVGVGTLAGTLGFSKRGIMNGPDGKPIHAELMLRGTTLMLGPENPALGKRSAKTVGASPAGLFLYIENVDQIVARAVSLGATAQGQVMDMFWGYRRGAVVDPKGYAWMVGTHKAEPTLVRLPSSKGLAQRSADGEVPSFLADKRILALDLSLIVAGTKYRGQFEERLKTIMKELMESQNAIIFIDELHTLVGTGSAEGSLCAANILKPALSRGEIQCIGAITPGEYRKSIEKDRSLERRFQAVKVPPPDEGDATKILFGVKDRYEKFHAVDRVRRLLHDLRSKRMFLELCQRLLKGPTARTSRM